MKQIIQRVLTLLILALLTGGLQARQEAVANIKNVYPEELRTNGFRLDSAEEIKIEIAGIHYIDERREDRFMFGYGWILNSETRKVVWEMDGAAFPRRGPRVEEYTETVRLPAGTYEAYFASFPYYFRDNDDGWHSSSGQWWSRGIVSNIFRGIFNRDDEEYDDLSRDFYFRITADGRSISKNELNEKIETQRKDALAFVFANRDEMYERVGFTLSNSLELDLYAVGEARRDGNFDYSYIMNAETREKVWRLDYRNSERAGGAVKNRMAQETITLPAGKYVAVVVTDDSHSPQEWNSPPPYDPAFWGLKISSKNADARRDFQAYDYEDTTFKNAFVSFTNARDDEFFEKGFTLNREMKLHIYAIGEGRDGEMFDYGWIVDANSREKVWEMKLRDTEHGGGAEKNRLYDETVTLSRGNYIAYFVTDDSHSYRDWNASPPYDQEHYGLSVMPADANFYSSDVSEYKPENDPNVLARIIHVRDEEYERKRFTLDRDAQIQIYALGEGMDGKMYDFGWIENAETGKVVWEMEYDDTDRAGGARKNRMVSERISLDRGEYIVFYESDDSHSFNDWNASPPHDPTNWGITITLVRR